MGDTVIKSFELSQNHWVVENFRETCTTSQWREYLRTHEHTLFFRGHLHEFRARSIGGGMLEISKSVAASR